MFPLLDMTSSFLFNLLLSIENEVICFLNLVTNYGKKQSCVRRGWTKNVEFHFHAKNVQWKSLAYIYDSREGPIHCMRCCNDSEEKCCSGGMSNCRMKLSYTSCEFLFISVQPKHTLGQVQF